LTKQYSQNRRILPLDSRFLTNIRLSKLNNIHSGKVEMKADISAYKDQIGNVMAKNGLVVGHYHFIGIYEPPRIIAFDTNTGKLAWTYAIDRTKLRGDSRGIYADGKLIWVRNTGDVYCFE
jgi:outer membrane protein assembly factor BamB